MRPGAAVLVVLAVAAAAALFLRAIEPACAGGPDLGAAGSCSVHRDLITCHDATQPASQVLLVYWRLQKDGEPWGSPRAGSTEQGWRDCTSRGGLGGCLPPLAEFQVGPGVWQVEQQVVWTAPSLLRSSHTYGPFKVEGTVAP